MGVGCWLGDGEVNDREIVDVMETPATGWEESLAWDGVGEGEGFWVGLGRCCRWVADVLELFE